MGTHREEGSLTFARIERMTPVLRPLLQLNQSCLCGLHLSRDQGKRGPNGQIVSIKRAADRKLRSREIIELMKKEIEKYRTKDESLQNNSTDSKGTAFVKFDKPCKRSHQKGKIKSREQSKEKGQPKVSLWRRRIARRSQKLLRNQ